MNRHTADDSDGGNGGSPLNRKPFLSYADLQERYGKTKVTIWRWVRDGHLPAPRQLGPNSVGFSVPEILEHEANLPRRTYRGQAEELGIDHEGDTLA